MSELFDRLMTPRAVEDLRACWLLTPPEFPFGEAEFLLLKAHTPAIPVDGAVLHAEAAHLGYLALTGGVPQPTAGELAEGFHQVCGLVLFWPPSTVLAVMECEPTWAPAPPYHPVFVLELWEAG